MSEPRLMDVVMTLREFRTKEMYHFNEHEGDGLEDKYIEGYLDGIEAAKNEVWRLSGARPF